MKQLLIALLGFCLSGSAIGQAIVTSPVHSPVYALPAVATSDPNWSSVKLLLKSSGSTFIDASQNTYTLTPDANTAQSTDVPFGSQKSFNVSSGTSRIIVSTSGANFDPGTGNWTMEAWVRLPLNHPAGVMMVFTRSYSGSNYWILSVNNNGSVDAWANHTTCRVLSAASVVAANVWTHLAWVRNGSTATLYVGGTSRGSTSAASVNLSNANTTTPAIGGYAHDAGYSNNGKIYDFRITYMARYTANFTPPTAPFPTN